MLFVCCSGGCGGAVGDAGQGRLPRFTAFVCFRWPFVFDFACLSVCLCVLYVAERGSFNMFVSSLCNTFRRIVVVCLYTFIAIICLLLLMLPLPLLFVGLLVC